MRGHPSQSESFTMFHFCDRTGIAPSKNHEHIMLMNVNIIVTYLFKDVVKEAKHIKKI